MSKLIESCLLNNILTIRLLTESVNNLNMEIIKNDIIEETQKNIFSYLIIDLSELRYIDSMGIGGIINVKRECKEKSFYCLVPPSIFYIFRLTKMEEFLNAKKDIESIMMEIHKNEHK